MGKVLKLAKPKTWEEYFEEFLLLKQVEGLRPRTLKDYRYHINRFFNGVNLEDWESIQKRVGEYFTENIAPATFNIRRKYLKSFFSYLVEQGALPQNPINFKIRKDEGKARALPQGVIEELLKLPNKKTFTGLRDYVLMLFTLDTGIRPGEAFKLLPENFNLEGREVIILPGVAKTKAQRTLPLSPLTCLWVKKLLSVRPNSWGENVPVFCSQDGKPMLTNSWEHRLNKYSKKLGYKVTPYDLRHTFALYSLREGMNPFALQRILGYTDLTMTKRYLALTQQDLQKEHEKSSPINLFAKKRVRKLH